MAKELGPREKFFALNGLVCLVQSLEKKRTTIDLRNESSVHGIVEDVDAFMNVTMSNAVFINTKGEKHRFECFFIQARNIRYVHIPEEVPIIGAIENQLGKILYHGKGRGQARGAVGRGKSWKEKRTQKNQRETLAMVAKIKEERIKKDEEQQ